jgi:hypothetical protein
MSITQHIHPFAQCGWQSWELPLCCCVIIPDKGCICWIVRSASEILAEVIMKSLFELLPDSQCGTFQGFTSHFHWCDWKWWIKDESPIDWVFWDHLNLQSFCNCLSQETGVSFACNRGREFFKSWSASNTVLPSRAGGQYRTTDLPTIFSIGSGPLRSDKTQSDEPEEKQMSKFEDNEHTEPRCYLWPVPTSKEWQSVLT